MGHKKLIRFEEITHFPNVLQYPEDMAGKWQAFLKNNFPITLELACGKGEYAVGLAEMYPQRNFIGVDLKGNRLWVGAKKALNAGLGNVAFLRTHIQQIADYFRPGEVETIWITFPDPQLRKSKAKKRLTHPKFLRLYQQILSPGGRLHLKTDSPALYAFTRQVISRYGLILHTDFMDAYAQEAPVPELLIRTHYEKLDIARSNRIHYLCFSLPVMLPGEEQDGALQEWVNEHEIDDAVLAAGTD